MKKLIAGIGIAGILAMAFAVVLLAVYTIRLNEVTEPASSQIAQIVTVTAGPYTKGIGAKDLTIHITNTRCFDKGIETMANSLSDLSPTTKRAAFFIPDGVATGQNFIWITAPNINSQNCAILLIK